MALQRDGSALGCGNLAILSCRASAETDRRLAKLAEMAGLHTIIVEPSSANLAAIASLRELESCAAVIANDSLFARQPLAPATGLDVLLSRFHSILIYSCEPGIESDRADFPLEINGATVGPPLRAGTGRLRALLSPQLASACGQLRDLQFMVDDYAQKWRAFPKMTGGAEALLTLEQLPLLMRYPHGDSDLYLSASGHVLDVDETVRRGGITGAQYLQLLPWLMFLRGAFGDACWHNPNPCACLIIDDPLLRPRYGFLDYEDLLTAADSHDFAASIAFIPWNHRRSHQQTVELFRMRLDRLSLCVHGSDHTGGEFERGDEASLRRKARTALSRMHEHHTSTGVGFDRVMIFPQGGFCKAALRALRAEGFMAAINTSVFAADWQPDDLNYRDLLGVALLSYGGCPLFSRRYTDQLFQLSFDLFMGKPAFIVQHHRDFRNGCDPIAGFTREIGVRNDKLSWNSPAQIVEQAALWKRVGPREQSVRFYTDDFSFRNTGGGPMTYHLQRQLPPDTYSLAVECDGAPLDFTINDSLLTAEAALEAGEAAHIHVSSVSEDAPGEFRTGAMYSAGVASRRMLSEFRDNYIARNQWLLARAEGMKTFMQRHNPRYQHRYR